MRIPRRRQEARLCGPDWNNINGGVEKGVNGEGVPVVTIIEAEPGGLELRQARLGPADLRKRADGRMR
jgi:hypothetical protein